LKYKGAVTFVEIGDHTTLREYVTSTPVPTRGT